MQNARWVMVFGLGLLVASIGNGAVSYLKRIGVLDHQAYERFVASYCELPRAGSDSIAARCTCMRRSALAPTNFVGADTIVPAVVAARAREYLYQNTGYERGLKFAKDVLFGGFVLLSLVLIRIRRARLPALVDCWLALLLLFGVGIGLAISLVLWGGEFAVVGLRSFAFLLIGLVGGWAVGGMGFFARCLGWFLLIQVVLVAIELIFGLPLTPCPHRFRAAAALVLPNSLGIATVAALAFYTAFSPRKNLLPILVLAALAIIGFSGSGTGLVALFAWLGMLTLQGMTGVGKRVTAMLFLVLATVMIVQLPTLTGRPDIYESLFATGSRVDTFKQVLAKTSTTGALIGQGVGVGTNTATTLAERLPGARPLVIGKTERFYADSTLTVFLAQLGILGIAAFYGLLGWAFWRDPMARPIYVVMVLSSLTINITELFPVNFLLGLVLAHSIAVSRPLRASA